MNEQSARELQNWLRSSPQGARLYTLEQKLISESLAQVFGWQLLQIGLWGDDNGLIADARTQRKSVLAWHGERSSGSSLIRSRTDSLAIASDAVAPDSVLLTVGTDFRTSEYVDRLASTSDATTTSEAPSLTAVPATAAGSTSSARSIPTRRPSSGVSSSCAPPASESAGSRSG